MAKSQNPKAKWPKEQLMHDETDILRRLRNIEARIQMAIKPNPMAKECRPRYSGVNEHARDARKSNKAFCLMGQISHKKPPFGSEYPPWFAHF